MIRRLFFIGGLMAVVCIPAVSEGFKAIKSPGPNLKETQYVQLQKIKTRDPDLGNGEYLFQPFSITVDNEGVYVYDILQAKIFKFDANIETVIKSFGQKGPGGPGDFRGTGKNYPVFIQMGRDGKLYAHELQTRKIIIFNKNGRYLGEFNNTFINMKNPLVDSAGNLHFITVKNKIISICNQKNFPMFTLDDQKDSFDYLFSTPSPMYLKVVSKNPARVLISALTIDSTFLLYFPSSSTIVLLRNNKIKKQITLWPQDALNSYQGKLKKLLNEEKDRFIWLFTRLFVDEDNGDMFYLQYGKNEDKGINALYQFNLNGNLEKVFYTKYKESESFTRILAKRNNIFYGIKGDKLIIYKGGKN